VLSLEATNQKEEKQLWEVGNQQPSPSCPSKG